MSVVLVTAPIDDALSLEEAKAHLRVEHDADDGLIRSYIAAAAGEIDAAMGGWLGRALRPQTWELRDSDFPFGTITLPLPPLIAVDAFTYTDGGGVAQTLVLDTDFRVVGEGSRNRAVLAPVFGKVWPTARRDHESVIVRFTAGYRPKDAEADPPIAADELPPPIRQALLLRVGGFYEFREDMAAGKVPMPTAAYSSLLAPYRIF